MGRRSLGVLRAYILTRKYVYESSWFSPKTEKRASPIHGRGLFARDAISAGEIVAVKGGTIMDSAPLALVRDEVSPAELQIEDDFYIAPSSVEEVEANLLKNH